MEATTQEIQVYSSSKKPSRAEYSNVASTRNQFYKKLITDTRASGANDDVQQLLVSCSGSKVCSFSEGNEILQVSEVEQLNERLKVLEEETEAMKQVFIETREERKKLVNELYQEFLRIQHYHSHSIGNQVLGLKYWDGSLIANPSDKAVVGIGLSHVLCEDSNPRIVTRSHTANMQFNRHQNPKHIFSNR